MNHGVSLGGRAEGSGVTAVMLAAHGVSLEGATAACVEEQSMQRIDESHWWRRRCDLLRAQRREAQLQGTSASASTSLAACYAQQVIKYWEHLLAAGQLDPSGCVSVLQWGAGTGRFAYLMLRELRERMAVSTLARLDVRYVVCDDDASAIASLHRHPRLREAIEAGRLAPLEVPPVGSAPWRQAMRDYFPATAPLVAIANDVLQEAEQQLLGFLDGKVFDAAVRRGDESAQPQLEWKASDRTSDWPVAWRSLVRAYAQRLDDVAVLAPVGAMTFIDACMELTGGRYLWLATDVGVHDERQLRAGVYADTLMRAPVNFDALSRYQRALGALTWNSAADAQGRVLHVAMREPTLRADDRLFGALLHSVQRLAPGDIEAVLPVMASSLAECTCEQLLAVVRAAHDDPRMFACVVTPLFARLDELTIECRLQWRSTLERVWDRSFPVGGEDACDVDIGVLAMHLGHWGVAKAAFATGLAMQGESAERLHRLSYCEASSGRSKEALALIESACALAPHEPLHQEFAATLRARIEVWSATPWFKPDDARDGELTLAPLGAEHASCLLFQYRDPQIGVMTRLPALNDTDEVLAWLDEQRRESGRALYAVMHACWGFVGVVSMRRSGDGAYCYFWIGADHQGEGLGQRATTLLLRQAASAGVKHMFTSAYRSNQRSCDALQRLGFRRLNVAATAPDEDLIFFHRPSDRRALIGADADVNGELSMLLEAVESPIRIAQGGAPAPSRAKFSGHCNEEIHHVIAE